MAYLVDTSVLLRLANTSDLQHALAQQAVMVLHHGGEQLHVTPQNMVEFYNAATRPIEDKAAVPLSAALRRDLGQCGAAVVNVITALDPAVARLVVPRARA